MERAGLPSLATRANNGATRTTCTEGFTDCFAQSTSFRPLRPGEVVRAGDIVVYAGHAGVASGVEGASGIQAMQNGTQGTQYTWFDSRALVYRRLVPNTP
jgi:hypothetical protein